MIKVETLTCAGTIQRGEDTCTLFVGMVLYPEELETVKLEGPGEMSYSVDEGEIVVVASTAPAEKPAK